MTIVMIKYFFKNDCQEAFTNLLLIQSFEKHMLWRWLGLNHMAFNMGYYLLLFDLAKIYASELTICHLLCHLHKVTAQTKDGWIFNMISGCAQKHERTFLYLPINIRKIIYVVDINHKKNARSLHVENIPT